MSKRKPIKLTWKDGVAKWGPLRFRYFAFESLNVVTLEVACHLKLNDLHDHIDIYDTSANDYSSIPAAKRAAVRICEKLRKSIPKEEL